MLLRVGWMPMLDGGGPARRAPRWKEQASRCRYTRDVTRKVIPREARRIQRRGRRDGEARGLAFSIQGAARHLTLAITSPRGQPSIYIVRRDDEKHAAAGRVDWLVML